MGAEFYPRFIGGGNFNQVKNCYNISDGAWPNGRASALGAEGSEFESRCPDFFMMIKPVLPSFTFLHEPGPGYQMEGDGASRTVLSPVFEPGENFISLILSPNYTTATNGYLLTEVQLRQKEQWSPFFKLAFYSKKLNHSFDAQKTETAILRTDELCTKIPAQAYRFQLTLHGEMDVSSVVVCVEPGKEKDIQQDALPLGDREIKVTPLSQMQLPVPPQMQKRLCSPTSLCMSLNALGVPADPLETAVAVYDKQADIYGNWTLNTAYAATRGLFACVTRFYSLAELFNYVDQNGLTLASISYKKGELSGAAAKETPGHLVLICGWANGQICVADPAAKTAEEVIRFYDAKEFAHAWLVNKHGAAYIVRKK